MAAFLTHIEERLLIVQGTSLPESVLTRRWAELGHRGSRKSMVGLLIATG